MNERPVEIAKELLRLYGSALLEDPERLGQLLEDKCPDCRQEIFVISFGLRDVTREEGLPDTETFSRTREKIGQRFCKNLGFTEEAAAWAVDAIASFLDIRDALEAEAAPPLEAKRGFLENVGARMAKRPRTAPVRKKALRNGLLLLGIIALFLGLYVRITSRLPASDAHHVLFLAHLSGPNAAHGHVRLKAAQMAVDQLNAQGGVKGRLIRIQGHDLPTSPADAVRLMEAFTAQRKVSALLTACDDPVNVELAKFADGREIPLLATESSSLSVTMLSRERPRLYAFRTNFDDAYRGRIMAYFLSQGLKRRRAALLMDAYDEDSREIRDSFLQWAKTYGTEVAYVGTFTRRGGVDRASVTQILSSGCEAVVLTNPTAEVAHTVIALRRFGYDGTVLGLTHDTALQNAAASYLDNSWWLLPASADDPQLLSFQTSYRDRYNESISGNDFSGALLAYDSVYLLANALHRAPGFQGEALRHAFLSTRDLYLEHAVLTIDPRTHAPWNKSAALVYCSDGIARFQRRFRPQY